MKVKQHIPKPLRFTLQEFSKKFPNDNACLEHLKEKRFPGGITYCAKCEQDRKHHRVTGRPAYSCDYCGKMISPMAGTIFEKSSTSLRTWFYAMYLMGSTRCGISAKQIQRETGVTYKTAWRMFKQIRSILSDGDLQLEGPTVEIDETYYGGKRKYGIGRPMRGDKKKIPIIGIVQREGGKVVAKVIPGVTADELTSVIKKHVLPGSVIYTDEYPSYERIKTLKSPDGKSLRYKHFQIRHKDKVYVNGHIRLRDSVASSSVGSAECTIPFRQNTCKLT